MQDQPNPVDGSHEGNPSGLGVTRCFNETPKCASCGEPAPGALPLAEVKDDDVRSAFCPLCKSLMQGHDEGIQEQSALTLHLVADAARRRLSDDDIRYVVERALAGEDPPIGVPLDLAADPSRPAGVAA